MQADEQKVALFEKMSIPRATMNLAIPTVISSLVMVLYNLADTYFVGMLANPVQNAAVTLAGPVLLAFNAVNNLFGVGTSSMMSRALGARDYDTVRRSSVFGFYCALMGGLLISLVSTLLRQPLLTLLGASGETRAATAQYLLWTTSLGAAPAILNVVMAYMVRAEGASLHASIGTMSGCFLNMLLDPIFILPAGLNMGAAGAGLATCISNCAACCYFFVLLRVKRGKTYISVSPRLLAFKKHIVVGVCAVGIPASIQNLLNVTGMTVLNNFAAAAGADAVAAMGIASKINSIAFQIALGLSQGVMPLISYNYACRNVKRMKQSLFFAGGISLSFITLMSMVYFFSADQLVRAFMDMDVIVHYGGSFLRGLCLGLPFLAVDFMAVGVFQACGMGLKALLFAILRKIVLEIPILCLLNKLFPIYGLAYSQFCAEVVLAIAACITVMGIFRRLERENSLMPRGTQKAQKAGKPFGGIE